MGKLVVCTNLTLDGVMQAPARQDEDARNGFTHGGWAAPYAAMAHVGHVFGNTGGLLLGRRTYEDFHAVWPKRPESPFSAWMDNVHKYVVSRTLKGPLPWVNSTLVSGDVENAVRQIKQQADKNLLTMGSADLIATLIAADLIDEYVLLIHPLLLGSGRRLFPDDSVMRTLRLTSSTVIPGGVIAATYEAAK